MLECRKLRKNYGDVVALDGVSLRVDTGELVGFVGSNGAGKSTTMRIAMGLLAPSAGEVRWDGEPITAAVRRRFGYMPEQRGLYPKMRIQDQVSYFGQLYRMTPTDADHAAAALLDRLQVVGKPTDMVQSLSLGNQQRVQLAVALVHDPNLLILDEPFSGLDPVGVDLMADVLRERAAAGAGILFSSHQLELVERLCDRVVIIAHGQVVADGTIDQLQAGSEQVLEIDVDAPDRGWVQTLLTQLPGTEIVDEQPRGVRLRLTHPDLDQQVLAIAAAAGRVRRFGWNRQSLTELYRSVVTA